MNERGRLLMELLQMSRPIEGVVRELAEFNWDSKAELVTLTRCHLKAVLGRLAAENLSAADVEFWANAVAHDSCRHMK
jgi:hypothetical protein